MSRREPDLEPLIIDRAAAAEVPSPEAIREWAHGRRGFISSVMAELPGRTAGGGGCHSHHRRHARDV
jgi:hypothetical protein